MMFEYQDEAYDLGVWMININFGHGTVMDFPLSHLCIYGVAVCAFERLVTDIRYIFCGRPCAELGVSVCGFTAIQIGRGPRRGG